MQLGRAIDFYVNHVTSVIEWLFLGILALAALYLVRSLKKESGQSETNSDQISQIEESLKKILEQASPQRVMGKIEPSAGPSLNVASSSPSSSSSGEGESAQSEIDRLKELLASAEAGTKELSAQLEAVKKEPGAGSSQVSDSETQALSTRVKELEAKLSDYDIIADDIADLSLFKQENSKLKEELERLKAGAPASAPATPAPDESAAVAPVAAESVAETTSPSETAVAASPDATAGAAIPPEAVVSSQPAEATPVDPANAPLDQASVDKMVTEIASSNLAATAQETPNLADDIMAEFAEVAAESSATSESSAVTVEVTPAEAPTPPAGSTPSALNVTLDPDKVLSEMDTMPKDVPVVPPQTADNPNQLIEEFENFMKTS